MGHFNSGISGQDNSGQDNSGQDNSGHFNSGHTGLGHIGFGQFKSGHLWQWLFSLRSFITLVFWSLNRLKLFIVSVLTLFTSFNWLIVAKDLLAFNSKLLILTLLEWTFDFNSLTLEFKLLQSTPAVFSFKVELYFKKYTPTKIKITTIINIILFIFIFYF